MKIENKEVTIQIGNKQKTFKNLILNSYLDLFADSFLNFKTKALMFCLVNFDHVNNITETSTSMQYNIVLNANRSEILTENSVTNKYYYSGEISKVESIMYAGKKIRDIGFAKYDYETDTYTIYAYLNLENHNILVQQGQPIYISRIDKITSDMEFYPSQNSIKGPIHLTTSGILEGLGMEYMTFITKLHSIGFGVLPQVINQENLVSNLTISKTDVGKLEVSNVLTNYLSKELYPNSTLYPSSTLYPQKSTYRYLIYKFKIYQVINDPDGGEDTLYDTGLYYYQSRRLIKYGKLQLSIRYERS